MIFLTVGTQDFQFNRLLEAVDKLIEENVIQDTVIAQIGCSTYVPRNYQTCSFLEQTEFNRLMEKCNLVITHGGVGTILNGLSDGKRILVVPRKKDCQEHVDDHQMEIADKFEQLPNICVCREIEQLGECYNHICSRPQMAAEIKLHYSNTARFLNRYLEEQAERKK